MKNPIQKGLLLIAIMCLVSCKKSSPVITDPYLTGKWIWLQSSSTSNPDTILNGLNTGIYKMLSFQADGRLTILHNDSTGQYGELQVYFISTLLPQIVVDSNNYHIEYPKGFCSFGQSPYLDVGNSQSYQYKVSNDTLYISNPPCLAPESSVYIKVQ